MSEITPTTIRACIRIPIRTQVHSLTGPKGVLWISQAFARVMDTNCDFAWPKRLISYRFSHPAHIFGFYCCCCDVTLLSSFDNLDELFNWFNNCASYFASSVQHATSFTFEFYVLIHVSDIQFNIRRNRVSRSNFDSKLLTCLVQRSVSNDSNKATTTC